MHRLLITVITSLVTLCFAHGSLAQIFIVNVGTLGPGDNVTGTVQFPTGGEIYVGLVGLQTNDGLEFSTLGSTADTEIAIYGIQGIGMLACNDDGGSDSRNNRFFDLTSYIWAGDGIQVDPGSAYYGPTCPNGNWQDDNQAQSYPSNNYTFVVGTFAISWDEELLRNTPACAGPGFSPGTGEVSIDIF